MYSEYKWISLAVLVERIVCKGWVVGLKYLQCTYTV